MARPLTKGVVAAGHRLTATAAAATLRDGGNAVDAAIAGLAMACVCEPVLASPGGGGFASVRLADGSVCVIDFFAHTPRKRRQRGTAGFTEVQADFGTARQTFHIGPATAAAPGFIAGIRKMHGLFGQIALPELFLSAQKAARDGVVVTRFQNFLAEVVRPILTASPEAAALYAPEGKLPAAGEKFFNPGLSDALKILAQEHDDGILREMVAAQAERGNLTNEDFVRYEAIAREPLTISIGDTRVHLNPLPAASGILIAHSLRSLRGTGAAQLATSLSKTGDARRAAKGELSQLNNQIVRQRGTTHISVIDGNANACAVTISNGEGNGSPVGEFGFMLNNFLGEEDVNPVLAGAWPTDTRLASMMCPTILETGDGRLVALGSGGSNRIRSAIFQFIVRYCLQDMDLEESVSAPRLHVEGRHLDFEVGFSHQERQALQSMFADAQPWPEPNLFFGGVHAVALDATGEFYGVGDKRRDGYSIVI